MLLHKDTVLTSTYSVTPVRSLSLSDASNGSSYNHYNRLASIPMMYRWACRTDSAIYATRFTPFLSGLLGLVMPGNP